MMDDGKYWKWTKMEIDLCYTRKEYDALPIFPSAETLDMIIREVEFDQRYCLITDAHDAPIICWASTHDIGQVKWAHVHIVEPEMVRKDRFSPA